MPYILGLTRGPFSAASIVIWAVPAERAENSKSQNPNPKKMPNPKIQIGDLALRALLRCRQTESGLRRRPKLSCSSRQTLRLSAALGFGAWDFFGIWSLEFGIL